MTLETLQPQNESENEISKLETEITRLEETVNNPDQAGVFDETGQQQLREKLQKLREELAVKSLENL